MATLLYSKGDYSTAEPLFRRAFEALELVLGAEHPEAPLSVNKLALLLSSKGDYNAAEPLHRRALEGVQKVLGPDHPTTEIFSVNHQTCLDAMNRPLS